MIQWIGKGGKKGRVFIFILFTFKWTKIKNLKKIKIHINKTPSSTSTNAQF